MELTPDLISNVRNCIVVIRDIPVITDADIASLYGVETKRVNEAVRNNPAKFPDDYMFTLSSDEVKVFAVEIFVHKSIFQKPVAAQSLYGEGTICWQQF